MMTKKHFAAIAELIRAEVDALGCDSPTHPFVREHRTAVRIAEGIADLCARENPNFDRGRFLRACGLQ
jgi:hypothetical protein